MREGGAMSKHRLWKHPGKCGVCGRWTLHRSWESMGKVGLVFRCEECSWERIANAAKLAGLSVERL